MIKNIVFDLGNVVLKGRPADILDDMQLNKDNCKIIKETFFSNWNELDLGNETIQDHFDKCKLPIILDEVIKEKIITYYKYRKFNIEILNIMKKLKNNNYNIYILSDNNIDAYKYLVNLQELKFIDGWIVSCHYHITKPNRRIYKILFEKFNLNPEECFFVDDKPINIEAGKSFGMNGHVLNFEIDGISNLLKDFNLNKIVTSIQ